MACKRSELVSAINSFGNARASGDVNLINYAGQLVGQFIETLEFDSEENINEEDETHDNQPE